MEPVSLPANQPQQFYLGGPQIEAFRGQPSAAPSQPSSTFPADPTRTPEDWIASTLSKFGSLDGATRLPDGEWLSDAVTARPEEFFSPAHIARFGANPALLVKLLDAGERLPVHCHPDRAFAEPPPRIGVREDRGLDHHRNGGWRPARLPRLQSRHRARRAERTGS